MEQWPHLANALAKKGLTHIDVAIAEKLLQTHPEAGEGVAAFLCHLSAAMREGHLCIEVTGHGIKPTPEELWAQEGDSSLSANDFRALNHLIIEGAAQLPEALFSGDSPPLYRQGDLFYFHRFWHEEKRVINGIKEITKTPPEISFDLTTLSKQLKTITPQLLPEQTAAILAIAKNSLTLVCGGPGTGKTYTAGQLIHLLWQSLNPDQQKKYEIALAAPTGKAAANLQQSLTRATQKLANFPELQAKTLHSLLGITKSTRKQEATFSLSADLLLIDESSMIDVQMMAQLLAAIKPGARLVLLGDPYQLPPVSTGMIFSDMVQALPSHVVTLKTCLRTDLSIILDFAQAIQQGDETRALQTLKESSSGIRYSTLSTQQSIVEHVVPLFSSEGDEGNQSHLMRFRLLSPLRKGPLGVDALNSAIRSRMLRAASPHKPFIAPIILTSNDRGLELYNGEVGLLVCQRPSAHSQQHLSEGDYALFQSRDDAPPKRLPALLLPQWEYAYCLSVHKSQGSEFDHVVLLMPEGSEWFGREMLYTAATRARTLFEIWGSDPVIQKTIKRHAARLSGILTLQHKEKE